ncbi:MAG: exodeoxyribonuclease VII large subunit [Chloroflexi bacterium]|nr:exodeoxyribonuclease VII large subunit [Chloroflexota bacterium]
MSEITRYISNLFKADEELVDVWVSGEVGDLSRSPRGHLYFSLKDVSARLDCAAFGFGRSRDSHFPETGDEVLCHGRVGVYEAGGRYQLYVDRIIAVGVGNLYREFELLKQRLEAEHLFDADRKRPVPRRAARIGVVSSASGAVIHDITKVLRHRWPLMEVVFSPSPVQGDEAAASVIEALKLLLAVPAIDAVIIARGGGSLEDLWPFNNEQLARFLATYPVPVVSAIGHQTDFTITDLVADLRAPTPTAAAELVSADREEERDRLRAITGQLQRQLTVALDRAHQRLLALIRQLTLLEPRDQVQRFRQYVDDLEGSLGQRLEHRLELDRQRLHHLGARLEVLSPQNTLQRGYAIVRTADAGRVVISPAQVTEDQLLDIEVARGSFKARAVTTQITTREEGRSDPWKN